MEKVFEKMKTGAGGAERGQGGRLLCCRAHGDWIKKAVAGDAGQEDAPQSRDAGRGRDCERQVF